MSIARRHPVLRWMLGLIAVLGSAAGLARLYPSPQAAVLVTLGLIAAVILIALVLIFLRQSGAIDDARSTNSSTSGRRTLAVCISFGFVLTIVLIVVYIILAILPNFVGWLKRGLEEAPDAIAVNVTLDPESRAYTQNGGTRLSISPLPDALSGLGPSDGGLFTPVLRVQISNRRTTELFVNEIRLELESIAPMDDGEPPARVLAIRLDADRADEAVEQLERQYSLTYIKKDGSHWVFDAPKHPGNQLDSLAEEIRRSGTPGLIDVFADATGTLHGEWMVHTPVDIVVEPSQSTYQHYVERVVDPADGLTVPVKIGAGRSLRCSGILVVVYDGDQRHEIPIDAVLVVPWFLTAEAP